MGTLVCLECGRGLLFVYGTPDGYRVYECPDCGQTFVVGKDDEEALSPHPNEDEEVKLV